MTDWGPFSLEGRRAIVTGAAMGIGFAIARRFVEGGADVLLVDLDEAALRSAAERLAGAEGKVETLALDVGDDDAGQRMVEQCVARFGGWTSW
jgi:NAD(P)-dependent dehydrogenase (short-subunit alcohol dehydrogenase family)